MNAAMAVRDRGILFTGTNVRAILDGRKTQTRRTRGLKAVNESPDIWRFDRWQRYPDGSLRAVFDHMPSGEPNAIGLRCPYGEPGDRLWVKENFRLRLDQDHKPPSQDWWKSGAWYEADGDCEPSGCGGGAGKLRPSIFMPRWASRITLEITEVRAEQVQDISEDDARAEGAPYYVHGHGPVSAAALSSEPGYWGQGSYRAGFEHGWNEIHGWSPNAWERNDWAWAITFRRLEAAGAAA